MALSPLAALEELAAPADEERIAREQGGRGFGADCRLDQEAQVPVRVAGREQGGDVQRAQHLA